MYQSPIKQISGLTHLSRRSQITQTPGLNRSTERKKLMADCKTVITKRNGYWNLLVGAERKLHFKSIYKKDCEAKRTSLRHNANKAKVALNDMTFLEVYKKFAEYKLEKANHPNSRTEIDSVRAYMSHYKLHLAPYIKPANIKIAYFGVPEMEDWLKAVMDAGIKFKTYSRSLKYIKAALRWSVSYRYATKDDVGPILNFNINDRPDFQSPLDEENMVDHGTMITPDQIAAALKHIANQKEDKERTIKYCIIATLAFTGMRPSELCGLKWENISFDRATIWIRGTLRKDGSWKQRTKKSGSHREMWMAPKLLKILHRWKRQHNITYIGRAKQWVFPQSYADSPVTYKWVRQHLYLTFEAIGLAKLKKIYNKGGKSILRFVVIDSIFKGCPLKCFRKFVAHYLLKSSPVISDQEKLQHIGHKDLKQTKEYAGDIETAMEISIEDPEIRNKKLVALDKTFPINPKNF